MTLFKNLHNYVKDNYENGEYKEAENAYKNWSQINKNYSGNGSVPPNDYQMGYHQANEDYEKNLYFNSFPDKLIDFVNLFANNKLSEISNYIKGYKDAQNDILKK